MGNKKITGSPDEIKKKENWWLSDDPVNTSEVCKVKVKKDGENYTPKEIEEILRFSYVGVCNDDDNDFINKKKKLLKDDKENENDNLHSPVEDYWRRTFAGNKKIDNSIKRWRSQTAHEQMKFENYCRGGFISLNKTYQNRIIKKSRHQEIYGIDFHGTYPTQLKYAMPYGPILYEKPQCQSYNFKHLKIGEICKMKLESRVRFMPPFIKDAKNKFANDYNFEISSNSDLYVIDEEFQFILKHYDIDYKIVDEFWIAKEVYLNKIGKKILEDKYNLQDGKLLSVAVIGYFNINQNFNKQNMPKKLASPIYPPIYAIVCMLSRLETLKTIQSLIDHGAIWVASMTDSIWFIIPKGIEDVLVKDGWLNFIDKWKRPRKICRFGHTDGFWDWIIPAEIENIYFANVNCYRADNAKDEPLKICFGHGQKGDKNKADELLIKTPATAWKDIYFIKNQRDNNNHVLYAENSPGEIEEAFVKLEGKI